MARLENKDIHSNDFLLELIKRANDANVTFEMLEETLKGILKVASQVAKEDPFKSFEGLKKSKAAIDAMTKATKGLEIIEQQKIKTATANEKLEQQRIRTSTQREAQIKKQADAAAKLNNKLKEESGILGRLKTDIAKLKKEKLFAKTPAQLTKVNAKLRTTEREFRRLSNLGVKGSNTFSKALDSFGFKFNLLSDIVSQAGRAVFNFFRRGISTVISSLSDLSESISDVQKTTGLTKEAVGGLIEEFKKFDTRTSIKGLLGIAEAAGRMGIASKDIVSFTKAVDVAFVSLGDDLGGTADEIATDLAKISDVFDVTKEFGAAEGIIKLGSAINQLSADTKAQAPFIEGFIKNMTGVREVTDISATDVLGLAATLDELGLSLEVASTATSQVLIKIAADAGKFARAAGVDVEKFKDLVNTDINEALIVFSEGITKGNRSTTDLAEALTGLGIKGARSTAVVGALSGNIDKLRENQNLSNDAFEKGTSLGEEFDIKNNNLAASIAKLGKTISDLFLSSGLVDFLNGAVKSTTSLIKGIIKLGRVFTVVGVAISTYAIAVNRSRIATILFTTGTKLATVAMRIFNTVVKANPLGLLLSAVAAVTAAFFLFSDSTDDASDSQEDLAAKVDKTNKVLERTFSLLQDIGKEGASGRSLKELRRELELLEEDLESTSIAKDAEEIKKAFETGLLTPFSLENTKDTAKRVKAEIEVIKALIKAKEDDLVIGLIAVQKNKISNLEKDKTNAKTEKEIASLNKKLVIGKKELKRLEDLGKAEKKLTGLIEKKNDEITKLNKLLVGAETQKEIDSIQEKIKLREEELDVLKGIKKEVESTIEIELDIAAQSEALAKGTLKGLEELDQQRIDNRKKILQEIIDTEKDNISEVLEAQNELNDIELDQLERKLQRERDLAEKRKELEIGVINAISEITAKAGQERLDEFDRQIQASVDVQDQLRQKAINGQLDAEESLAAEQASQAKLEEARRKEEAKQENLQAFLALLTAGLEAGKSPQDAFATAGIVLAAAPTFVDALPTFFEGTDGGTVAESLGAPQLSGRDGHIIRADGKETIITGAGSAKIPNWMNENDIVNAAMSYQLPKQDAAIIMPQFNDSNIVGVLNEVLKHQKSVRQYEGMEVDKIQEIIDIKLKQNNKYITQTYKLKRF